MEEFLCVCNVLCRGCVNFTVSSCHVDELFEVQKLTQRYHVTSLVLANISTLLILNSRLLMLELNQEIILIYCILNIQVNNMRESCCKAKLGSSRKSPK